MRPAIVTIACILVLLLLTSCSKADPPQKVDPPVPVRLCSVSYSHSHMNRFCCFGFELYEHQGQVYFSCHCCDQNSEEVREYDSDNIVVPAQELQNAQAILDKHHTKEFLQHYRAPLTSGLQVMDAPSTSLSARWSDTKSLNAQSAGEAKDELEAFFRQLTAKYSQPK